MKFSTNRGTQRGVSLIEAIVALAVMAFGLVAVVGLQATLRGNADVSRQRTEAVRMAQEEIERWRAFVSLQADAGKVDFGDIADDPAPAVVTGLNATYAVRRSVPAMQAPAPRTVSVSVSWQDRADQTQTVTLSSAIAGISPELAGSLVLPPNQGQTWRVNNRNPLIPRMAKDFGDGKSGFVPPQQGTGPRVAWVFNNVTGVIERVCTVEGDVTTDSLTAASVGADNRTCDTSRTAQLLSGYVNFANPLVFDAPGDVGAIEAETEAPSGLPLNLNMALTLTSDGHPDPGAVCFDDSPLLQITVSQPVTYYCAIFSNPARTWSGRLRVIPQAFTDVDGSNWTIGIGAADRKVCRYTTLANDGTATSKNSAHPLDYTRTGSAAGAVLGNQNFLVIRGPDTCPLDEDWQVNPPPANDPVNSSTRIHQNGVSPYL